MRVQRETRRCIQVRLQAGGQAGGQAGRAESPGDSFSNEDTLQRGVAPRGEEKSLRRRDQCEVVGGVRSNEPGVISGELLPHNNSHARRTVNETEYPRGITAITSRAYHTGYVGSRAPARLHGKSSILCANQRAAIPVARAPALHLTFYLRTVLSPPRAPRDALDLPRHARFSRVIETRVRRFIVHVTVTVTRDRGVKSAH